MSSKENSKIRINALLRELDRQQLEIRKKKNLIRVIVFAIIFVFVVTFGFIYKESIKNTKRIVPVERKEVEFVKKKKLKPKYIKTYQLVFDSLGQYPLARFLNIEQALSFQKEIKKLHLPKTNLSIDSLDRNERILAVSSNYRYYIQIGIFRKQLISDLPENMVYLHQIKDKNLYKYRIGPFAKSIQAKKLVEQLNLKDYLIVEVSN